MGHCHQNHCYLTTRQQWHLLKQDGNHDRVQDTGTLRWGAPEWGAFPARVGAGVHDWTLLGHSGLPAATFLVRNCSVLLCERMPGGGRPGEVCHIPSKPKPGKS